MTKRIGALRFALLLSAVVGVAFTGSSSAQYNLKTLYAFGGSDDGFFPNGGLVFDSAGNLYGTTYCDGANTAGNVWELTP